MQKKDKKRLYQRCVNCYYRAFEFKKNPNHSIITAEDIMYAPDRQNTKPFDCQHCGVAVHRKDFGHNNLIAREPTGYTKYKGANLIHWTWYINGYNFPYKELVDNSLKPFEGYSGKVLDIGSGDGLIDSLLMKMGFEVIGIEPEKEGIEASLRMLPDFKQIRMTTVENYIKSAMTPVDYMYSMNTIEHVEDPEAFVKVMKSVKNFAIVVTDNALNKEGQRRGMKELHNKEFSYDELEKLFKDFKTEKVEINNGSFIAIKIYANR